MPRRELAIILVVTIMSLSLGQAQSESATGLEGVITIGPIQPGPARQGVPDSAPLANFTFTVANEKGAITSFTTDAQGRFRVPLAPGHYTISQSGKDRIRRCGPFDVDVVIGKMTAVEWECDTGMR
jgi:hypothetical protein